VLLLDSFLQGFTSHNVAFLLHVASNSSSSLHVMAQTMPDKYTLVPHYAVLSILLFLLLSDSQLFLYRGADKSSARRTSRCILFDGKNISFDASLYIYIYIYIYIYKVKITEHNNDEPD
jgi:hypothetical protein